MDLRNVLRDLVNTTSGIDFTCIAVSNEDRGEGQRVYMESYTEDKTLVMRAFTKENVPDFEGRFGLTNLGTLQGLMNLKTFSTEGTTITVNQKAGKVQSLGFASEDASTVFVVQSEKFIPAQPRFTEKDYAVTVTPTAAKVQELKSFSGVFKAISALATPYTEDGNMFFHVGEKNKNNHTGAIQFSKAEGDLKLQYGYAIDRILQTLGRVSNAESASLSVSATGILKVTIDTGLVVYQFFVHGC